MLLVKINVLYLTLNVEKEQAICIILLSIKLKKIVNLELMYKDWIVDNLF